MYKCIALLIAQFQGALVGIIVHARHQAYFRTIAASRFDLADRRTLGQAYYGLDPGLCSTQGNSLGMIACRTGYHTALLLFGSKLRNTVIRTTHLEGARQLQALGLKPDIRLGIQTRSRNQVGRTYNLAQHIPCLVNII